VHSLFLNRTPVNRMSITIDIAELIAQTDAAKAPVRLEYVRGRMKWEASPASRHQKALQRIERSLRPIPGHPAGCGCFVLADTLIRFPDPDHSIKRPDLAIFCTEPPDSDEALTVIPAAVVEVLSLGYEEKDLGSDGAPFYLAYGVQDVLIVDPRTGVVYHDTPDAARRSLTAPITIDLRCGCRVTVA
jgi:Uma2 family endonuclease